MNYYNEIPPNHNISTHASDTYAKRALDLKKKKESIFHVNNSDHPYRKVN